MTVAMAAPHRAVPTPLRDTSSLERAVALLLSQQTEDGYWWYTLEANETIGAGVIQLQHFIGDVDRDVEEALARRILSQQREDGSWAVFKNGPGDLSTTIECYFSLRLSGRPVDHPALVKARSFIIANGGLTKMRVFSRIHLALFGLVPWSACPSMPIWLMLLPPRSGASIYEFSSWARASIVPLLLIDAVKPIRPLPFSLDELFSEPRELRLVEGHRVFRFPKPKRTLSLENVFLKCDKLLKLAERLPFHPGKRRAMRKAEAWTREHIAHTEDIYPAMAYGILALSALGHPNSDSTIQKALEGLKRFRQREENGAIHQQCCISPNWDTPWAAVALLDAGVPGDHPSILKAARYMISKEVKDFRGDWAVKNPRGPAGGCWSFEFENDYFPDVDDTIEALHLLKRSGLPPEEKDGPVSRGLAWLLSMQCDNGGWAAFDKNNVSPWVNRIPFSDHGACLDPPTPDITGRMIEILADCGFKSSDQPVRRALTFLEQTQEPNGAWRGRWGVNFVYGTWCVLQGLAAAGINPQSPHFRKAVRWLESIQNKDGGWGESCLSDARDAYVPLGRSTASQTAWAVMALLAAGERDSIPVHRGVQWLTTRQTSEGGWDEAEFTGTGFPGHFYIRYHGYRYYFPTLALGKYFNGRRLS
jgi:squalene-hopene/tetraprenyl-beta-curcumene cyclase